MRRVPVTPAFGRLVKLHGFPTAWKSLRFYLLKVKVKLEFTAKLMDCGSDHPNPRTGEVKILCKSTGVKVLCGYLDGHLQCTIPLAKPVKKGDTIQFPMPEAF